MAIMAVCLKKNAMASLSHRLVLETDLERAGQTDDLTQTVDYSAVYGVVKAVVEGPSYDLIERVGQVIADRILAQFPPVQALTVTVHKPQRPSAGPLKTLPSSWKGGAMAKFYLSIGANLGDRMATLRQAVRLLADTPGVTVTAVSPFYETPPWGKTDQPAFINGAVAVETEGPDRSCSMPVWPLNGVWAACAMKNGAPGLSTSTSSTARTRRARRKR